MKLTQDNLFEIIKKSIDNSSQLIVEANLLREHKKYARAYTLYQLSIEEVGKAILTFGFLLNNDFEDPSMQKVFLKDFRDHKAKTKKSMGIDILIAESIDDELIKKRLLDNILKQDNDIEKINEYKNYSLYTSIKEDKILLPSQVISEKMANDLGFYAFIRQLATKQTLDILTQNFDELKNYNEKILKDKMIIKTVKHIVNTIKEK
jgi:AbiV family abortive infection protein